jgi:hypothetical protein
MSSRWLSRIAIVASLAAVSLAPARAAERLGIQGRFLEADAIAGIFNRTVPKGGVLVEHVEEGSPAALAGLRGGDVEATIQGETMILGGDLILQLEVHNVCTGECLKNAPTELEKFSWIGVTYLRRGRVERAVIEVGDPGIDPTDGSVAPPTEWH